MRIRLLAMDVDGTLTDGRIYIGPDGEVMKAFDVKDGFGIAEFVRQGGIPVVITGRGSKIVENRCRELKISECFQNVDNKLKCLKEAAERHGVSQNEIAYIGDDMSDLDCIGYAGISACPADAVAAVRDRVDYVCEQRGGHGALREFIDWLTE